jgi:hypothetical protein
MPRKTLILAIALAAGAAPAFSQTMVSQEDAIEASTIYVSLPASVPARWTFKACASCEAVTVDVDANSQFYVGQEQVSLAVLRKYAARGASQIDIFAEPKTRRLTRVILRTELDNADRAQAPGKQ